MNELDRDDCPPRPGPAIEIRRLRKSEACTATFLSVLQGFWTHWNGMRSEPCFRNHKECPGHLQQHPRRWKGYIHIHDDKLREEQFLELTPIAAKSLLNIVGLNTTLRGQRAMIQRMNGNKARLTVQLLTPVGPGIIMPAAKDVYPILANLWHLPEGKDLWGGDSDIPDNDETM